MDVLTLKSLIDHSNLTHGLVCLGLELAVVEIDQLVTETINVSTKASLSRQNIIVIVNVLI